MAGKLGLGLLETLLENLDRDLNLENTTLTNPTITTSAVATFTGGVKVNDGRIREVLTLVDNDAQANALSAAEIKSGLVVHTSVTGGGDVTPDTAANIISTLPLDADGQCVKCYYINDGNQTLTVQGSSTGITYADSGQTIAANEAAILLFRRTGAAAVTVYVIGA